MRESPPDESLWLRQGVCLPPGSILICQVSSGFYVVCLWWHDHPGPWHHLRKAKNSFNLATVSVLVTEWQVKQVRRSGPSYQMTVVGHDVIFHPCWRLQLLPTVLTGEWLLHTAGQSYSTLITLNIVTMPINVKIKCKLNEFLWMNPAEFQFNLSFYLMNDKEKWKISTFKKSEAGNFDISEQLQV